MNIWVATAILIAMIIFTWFLIRSVQNNLTMIWFTTFMSVGCILGFYFLFRDVVQ